MGKFFATIIMMLGYVIIAVPTGIVAVSLTAASKKGEISTQACPTCSRQGHDSDAAYCKYCGRFMKQPIELRRHYRLIQRGHLLNHYAIIRSYHTVDQYITIQKDMSQIPHTHPPITTD